MGTLFVVATPIGNLEDTSLRAIRILREADRILCEDTRVTRKLLSHFQIDKPLLSYHQHSRIERLDDIVEYLRQGEKIALVSDAGTPGISDPGNVLVEYVNRKLGSAVRIEAIPGASALTVAASASGLPTDHFTFLGFLPHKKGRETLFKRIVESDETIIFYESPHRFMKTLDRLNEILTPERIVFVARELTKKFEECWRGPIAACHQYYQAHPDHIRGEFVVIVSGVTYTQP